MAKLAVKPLKIFGSALSPTGNVAQHGSTAAGAAVYSDDPTVLQALAAWINGYAAAVINTGGGQSSPVLEELNAILYVLTYTLAYLKEEGIAEWDATVNYQTSSFATDGAGVIYHSKTADNLNHALSNGTYWETLASMLSLAAMAKPTPIPISAMGTPRTIQAGDLLGTAQANFVDLYNKQNEVIAALKAFGVPIAS
jgi:hypothetical protein